MPVSQAALKNLSQLLKTEEDLDKVAHLKTQLQTEKSSLEVQLRNLTQSQLDRFLSDIDQLTLCQDDVKELRENLGKVETIAQGSFGSVSRYELINNITHVHEIFDHSTRIAERVSQFHDDLEEVDRMIEQEQYETVGPEDDVPGLLFIHYKLNLLRDFQDQILELSLRSSDDSKFIVKRLTSRTEGVVKKFDVLLGNLIGDLVETVKENNFSLVVRLAKIIEFEERQDAKIDALQKVLSAKDKGNNNSRDRRYTNDDDSLFEQIVNGTIQGRTKTRNYKTFFQEKVHESVKEIFKNCWEAFVETPNVFEILNNNLDWVYHDLACVFEEVTKLVPPKWNIFKLYYEIYYQELHGLINRLIELEPETLIILDILDFDNEFQDTMKSNFNMSKPQLQTIIGEVEKEKLLDDYLNLLVMKMKEWMGNLQKTEHEVFKMRKQAPTADSEKLLGLEGTKIVFSMFTQQCDAAAGSQQGKVLAGVINEFGKLLIKRQDGWGDLVKSEVQKWLISTHPVAKSKKNKHDENVDENNNNNDHQLINDVVPPGLMDYLTALANDQMKSADNTEAIANKFAGMVSKKYSSMIHADIEDVINGYANLAKQCCDGLIVIVFDDLNSVMDKIFSKEWTTSNHVQQVCDTLLESLGDFKMSMNSYLFDILADEILEECILRYLNNLNNDVKFPKTTDKLLTCVKRDFEVLYKLFIEFLDETTIQSKFKIVENFMDLSTATDPDSIVTHWQETVANFNDIKPEFLSLVLKARRDIDSSDAKLILPRAKQVQKEFLEQNQYDLDSSFMGRFDLSAKLNKNYL